MWPDLIAKSKEGGVDVIQTYVFWNGHEAVRGQVVGQIPEHFFFFFFHFHFLILLLLLLQSSV